MAITFTGGESYFRPFTYDDMIKPLLQYKEQFDKYEENYSDLLAQAEEWRNIANREKSPKAFAMYNRFSNDLQGYMNDFFSNGLNVNNKAGFSRMRGRYGQDITPIAKAHERRTALAEEQRQAKLKDPSLMFERNANDMSLDTFIDNMESDYGASFSGDKLTANVAAIAGQLAKEYQNNPSKLQAIMGNSDYFEYIKSRGFKSSDILQVLQDDPNASKVLKGIVENEIASSGILNWSNVDEVLPLAQQYANKGLWAAVGQDDAQIVDNWRAKANLQHSQAIDLAKKQAELNHKNEEPYELKDGDGKGTGIWYSPRTGAMTQLKGQTGNGERVPIFDFTGNPTGEYGQITPSTITDEQGNIIQQPSNRKPLGSVYYDSLYNDTSGGADIKNGNNFGYDYNDEQLIVEGGRILVHDKITLSDKFIQEVTADLSKKGYKWNEVNIYVDHDPGISDSHFRAIPIAEDEKYKESKKKAAQTGSSNNEEEKKVDRNGGL